MRQGKATRNSQRGVSVLGLLAGLIAVIVLALLGMRVLPSYMEYSSAKTAIEAISKQAQTPGDARKLFYNRSVIDNITSVKAEDLDVVREGNTTIIGFAYRKEISLFGPVGLYIDYAASTR